MSQNTTKTQINKQLKQGYQYFCEQNYTKAEQIYRSVIDQDPTNYIALKALGLLAVQFNNFDSAIEILELNIKANPDRPEPYNDLGELLLKQNRSNYKEAIELFYKSLDIDPSYHHASINLGNVLSENSKLIEAQSCLKKAMNINPDNHEIINNLGITYQHLGQIDKAIELYRQSIALNPKYSRAYYNLALTKQLTKQDPMVTTIKNLLKQKNLQEDDAIYLHFALARIYEQEADYNTSFKHLKLANDYTSKQCGYNIEQEAKKFQAMKRTFNIKIFSHSIAELYTEFESNFDQSTLKQKIIELDLPTPIFIVGMPRSGTTLVEQIIASHPDVYGAGELHNLEDTISSNISLDKDYNLKFKTDEPSNLSLQYLENLKEYSPTSKYISDKMPANFTYIGFIKLLLPHAKIIHCRRDPVATCFSCYQQYFNKNLAYIHSLEDLAAYYDIYSDLMKHWHELFSSSQNPIFDIQYEDLIANQETSTKELLAYCGLDWNEACLNFHQNDRAVATASFKQVRRPIYKSSIEKWKNYKEYIRVLIDKLG